MGTTTKVGIGRRIEITAEAIERAVYSDSGHCMIAEAVKTKGGKRVSVDVATIRYTYEGSRYIFLTPLMVQQAIVSFDRGIRPEPFAFRLGAPAQVVPEGWRQDKRRGDVKVRTRTREGKQQTHEAPVVHGGRTPPLASKGKIRRFGVRMIGSIIEHDNEQEAR